MTTGEVYKPQAQPYVPKISNPDSTTLISQTFGHLSTTKSAFLRWHTPPVYTSTPKLKPGPSISNMGSLSSMENGTVLDIGGSSLTTDIGARLRDVLKSKDEGGKKPVLPDEYLYNDLGLELWRRFISQHEFYQTRDEVAMFQANGKDIAKQFARDSKKLFLLDIGAGYVHRLPHCPCQCLV